MKCVTITREFVVDEFAEKIADLQKRADEEYYKDNLPKAGKNEGYSWLMDQVFALKQMAVKLGICKDVYTKAYTIYDFRNSGKDGYTLRDGRIVKV